MEELEHARAFAVNMDPIACNSDVLTRGIRVRVRRYERLCDQDVKWSV